MGQVPLTLSEPIAYYLGQWRQGDRENAYYGLLELGPEAFPALVPAIRAEGDLALKRVLLEIVWQYRDPSAVPFLLEMLHEPNPEIWKEALDGLVTLASGEALEGLLARRGALAELAAKTDAMAWLEQAIEQVGEELQHHAAANRPVRGDRC